LTTVELFAGIGGFRIAADSLSIQTSWANDISKKSCIVYRSRFGDGELCEGDIESVKSSIPRHDLLTGGFPCQPFSSAGKKEGTRDARGTLFQQIIDVLNAHRPRYFVLENVKRLLTMEKGSHFATILGALAELDYFVEWRLLNAASFGLPQSRERVFIIGELAMPNQPPITDGYCHVRMAGPQEIGSLKASQTTRLFDPDSWRMISKHNARFEDWGVAFNGRFFASDLPDFVSPFAPVKLASVLESEVAEDFDFTKTTLGWLDNNTPVNRYVNGVEILSNQRGGARMGYTIFGTNGVAPTLTSATSRHYERYKIGDQYRRLTNVEYARIQGFPDQHCREISIYDQYILYGNAVPPPMAEWVLSRLSATGVSRGEIPQKPHIPTLFDHA